MKTVLILEDNKISLNALKQAVESMEAKINVCTAMNVEEAYRILYDNRVDLFVLDIILTTKVPGDTSGMRFAEKIREMEPYRFTPIIFITALADPQMYAYRNLHSYAYLEKPFSMAEAVELITQALSFPVPEEKRRVEYFRKDGILIAVNLRDVMYAEVRSRRMQIHLRGEVLEIPYIGVQQFLKKSRMSEFVQCSRYALVNLSYVKSIDSARRFLQMRDGSQVEIGSKYMQGIKQNIRIFSADASENRVLV